jgi:hypothetical protein
MTPTAISPGLSPPARVSPSLAPRSSVVDEANPALQDQLSRRVFSGRLMLHCTHKQQFSLLEIVLRRNNIGDAICLRQDIPGYMPQNHYAATH